METIEERRRRKLAKLCERHGREVVAKCAGVSEQYLYQIIAGILLPARRGDGERKPRALGSDIARRLEQRLNLGHAWFDNDDPGANVVRRDIGLHLSEYAKATQSLLNTLISPSGNQRAVLVDLGKLAAKEGECVALPAALVVELLRAHFRAQGSAA